MASNSLSNTLSSIRAYDPIKSNSHSNKSLFDDDGTESNDKEVEQWMASHSLRYSDTCKTVFHVEWSPCRQRVSKILTSAKGEFVLLLLLMVNLILVVIETDQKAAHDGEVPRWLKTCLRTLLCVFLMEITARLYVERWYYFAKQSNCLDITIVGGDLICEVIRSLTEDMELPAVSVLRVFRVLRLARVIRFVRHLRELSFMMQGMVGATKAMFWASIFLFGIVSVWSIIAVEILNPLNVELAQAGAYERCERCGRAFKSVMDANLTFAQQIIAGDSWGQVSIPIMEAHPWTAFIFMGVMLSVNLGVMNLVLAVIVDKAVECHNEDLKHKVKLKEREFQYAAKQMLKLCKKMDVDKDGTLDFQEVLKGYDTVPEFAMTLKSMDAGRDDLATVFAVLDDDQSGTISTKEFVEQLYRMKTQDSHTLLMFLKFYVKEIRADVKWQVDVLKKELLKLREFSLGQSMSKSESGRSLGSPWEAVPPLPEVVARKGSGVSATDRLYPAHLAVQPSNLPAMPINALHSDDLFAEMGQEMNRRERCMDKEFELRMHNDSSKHIEVQRSREPASHICNPSEQLCGRGTSCFKVEVGPTPASARAAQQRAAAAAAASHSSSWNGSAIDKRDAGSPHRGSSRQQMHVN